MSIHELIKQHFDRVPTPNQESVFTGLQKFILLQAEKKCFVLRGYAGTGKTTIIGALVKALPQLNLRSVLLAPTGRAAKVISGYSGKKALTIHKKIYRKKSALSQEMSFVLGENLHENTLFIVDEASMISNDTDSFNRRSLLYDLIRYVFNNKNCSLIFVGDTAQLPPVGSAESPALNAKFLSGVIGLTVTEVEMTDVVRQEKTSGILLNATNIRELIRAELPEFPKIISKGYPDIYRMTGERLPEGLEYAYNKYGIENALVICRSNKSANIYNQQIRNRILYREEELTGGDYIMVVRNNYYWLQQEETNNAFIANGDIAKIRKVRNITDLYGFRFADVVLEFIDYPEEEPLTCKVLLDTLYAETPGLSTEDSRRLFETVLLDYEHIPNKRMKLAELKNNEYFNALQIKFSYAVTCHKAQGGQWEAVFVDQGYLTDEMMNTEFLRWFYTAVTRATKELFLVNFSGNFFK